MTPHFTIATREYLDLLVRRRVRETKLGERVDVLTGVNWMEGLKQSKARYVLLGIPEDIGVRANEGVGGAHTLWEPALKAILNVQETDALPGDALFVLGAFDFGEWMCQSEGMDIAGLRALVALMDDVVYPVIQAIVTAGKIPVIIGGGHNNSYPLLKGASLALGMPVSCINLDAHSDYRSEEGRHSGNGFRYARTGGYLSAYAMLGLHRSYNSREVLSDLDGDPALRYSFYEDIFLRDEPDYPTAIRDALNHTGGRPTGIELDLDCIAGVLSSAATPCGITPLQARQYLVTCRTAAVAYVHLAEGAVKLRDGRTDPGTAKLVAYLVTDLIRNG